MYVWNESKEGYVFEPTSIDDGMPLDVQWKLLGEFKESGQKLAFDEHSDSLILSKYREHDHEVQAEILSVDKYMDGYTFVSSNVSDQYDACQRFTPDIICCSTSKHSHVHRTDCYNGVGAGTVHSSASHFDFSSNWQTLYDDKLLIVFTGRKHAVLDLRLRRIYKIEENRLPEDFHSQAFFFPLDNAQELDELVRSDQEFRICEYLRSADGDYVLKSSACQKTPFRVEYDLRRVKFCTNPLYTAVLQYGHAAEERDLSWRLRLTLEGAPRQLYGTAESIDTESEELVMDCNDDAIEVYLVGRYELSQYTVRLPVQRAAPFLEV